MLDKRAKKSVKIMVFGTFDGLHQGHLNFFQQARNLDRRGYLIVSVARDRNVKKIKGQTPIFGEKKRMNMIKRINLADKVVLSGLNNYLLHILREKPVVIALGYDQKSYYVKNLKKNLAERGLKVKIVRLKPYKEKIYKNRLLKNHHL